MGTIFGIGTDLLTVQNAAAAPKLIRGSKTFTGAANLGAVGVNELFTTTGVVLLEGFWVRCTDDLVDAVDGAFFEIGVTGDAVAYTRGAILTPFDLDTINAGDGIDVAVGSIRDGWSLELSADRGGAQVILDNLIMTISAQAITGGMLEFFILYRPLSADGALSLGAGMVSI